ncbi:tetratricopeptide repeat protein [Desulfocastanea catecholica]
MGAVTYPTKDVVNLVNNYLIPLRINIKDDPILDDYHQIWTPTIIVLDFNGKEIQRTIGFLEPDEFIPMIQLGIAKVRLGAKEYDTAMISLKSIIETYPESEAAPEAVYFRGVTLYKQEQNPGKLKEAYEKLLSNYPDSAWTKRAQPYRLL